MLCENSHNSLPMSIDFIYRISFSIQAMFRWRWKAYEPTSSVAARRQLNHVQFLTTLRGQRNSSYLKKKKCSILSIAEYLTITYVNQLSLFFTRFVIAIMYVNLTFYCEVYSVRF